MRAIFHKQLNAPPRLSACSPEHFCSDRNEDAGDLSLQFNRIHPDPSTTFFQEGPQPVVERCKIATSWRPDDNVTSYVPHRIKLLLTHYSTRVQKCWMGIFLNLFKEMRAMHRPKMNITQIGAEVHQEPIGQDIFAKR